MAREILKEEGLKMKYSKSVMTAVRQYLGLEPDDTSRDTIIESREASWVWRSFLIWRGIIGYDELLHEVHEDIFGSKEKGEEED